MAILTFSYDTGAVDVKRITDAFALAFNYQNVLFDPVTHTTIPNPETKDAFCSRMVRNLIITTVKNAESAAAADSASSQVKPIDLADTRQAAVPL